MAFLLGIIFCVALAITLIGFFLSSRASLHNERPSTTYRTSGATSSIARVNRRAGKSVSIHNMRSMQRYVEDIEPRSISSILQSISVRRIFERRANGRTSWTGLLLILVAVFLLGVYMLNVVLPNSHLGNPLFWALPAQASSGQNPPQGPLPAPQKVVRLSQLDVAQYNSPQEYSTWAMSACSAAAMAEVLNSYGYHYRVTDILKVESQLGEITPALGLVEDIGVARTVARFGFNATYMHNESLNDVINVANKGEPVIVSFPPSRYEGGHILVVIGGNANSVYLADSSRFNRQSLTRAQFLNWWAGFAVIVTPKQK